MKTPTRTASLAVAAVLATGVVAACGAPTSQQPGATSGEVPTAPGKAVTLNVLDVAGNLQLTQGIIDDFVKQHPDVISR